MKIKHLCFSVAFITLVFLAILIIQYFFNRPENTNALSREFTLLVFTLITSIIPLVLWNNKSAFIQKRIEWLGCSLYLVFVFVNFAVVNTPTLLMDIAFNYFEFVKLLLCSVIAMGGGLTLAALRNYNEPVVETSVWNTIKAWPNRIDAWLESGDIFNNSWKKSRDEDRKYSDQ